MQIKTTVLSHLMPVRRTVIKKITTNAGKNVQRRTLLYTARSIHISPALMKANMEIFQKIKGIPIIWLKYTTIYSKNSKTTS